MRSRASRHPDDLGIYGLPGDVSPWEIEFSRSDRAFVEVSDNGTARVRIHAQLNLTDIRIVVRRPTEVISYPMARLASTRSRGYWEATVPDLSGNRFSFAMRSPTNAPVYFSPAGVTAAIERLDRFVAPHPHDNPPKWTRGVVIYQIFPDRFAKTRQGNRDLIGWNDPPASHRFHGGDLDGITGHLDYLEKLGVELVYLNPVFRSPSNHRYDAIDYYEVDPMLGGNEAFLRLVDAIHDRKMRIIADVSLNHVHPRFFAFEDLVKNGERSQYRDWFVVHDWPPRVIYRPDPNGLKNDWIARWEHELGLPIEEASDRGPTTEATYECWSGVPSMPRVNLANPEARRYMIDVATHWVEGYGIDGWRMDVARYVDPDFWPDLRAAVKAADPNAFLLAEVMGDASAWLQGDSFDATMNYTFREIALGFLARRSLSGQETLDALVRLWGMYGWEIGLSNQNLIDSHDTPRFVHEAGNDLKALELAIILQMTFPGSPSIYYGTEVGLGGGNDPKNRAPFPWDSNPTDHQVFSVVSSLAALRRNHPSLRLGDFRPLAGAKNWLSFERSIENERLVTVLNRGSRAVSLPAPGKVESILWGTPDISGDSLIVPARSAVVIQLRSRNVPYDNR